MKMLNLSMIILTFLGLVALPAQAEDVWVQEANRIVYYAPRPDLAVRITRIGASEEYWDQLDADLTYDGPSAAAQYQALAQQYAGYEVRRVVLNRKSDFRIAISGLDRLESVPALPGQQGPYMHFRAYVPKARSQQIRELVGQRDDAVLVTGEAVAHVPMMQVLERIELDEDACDRVSPKTISLETLALRLHDVLTEIDKMDAKYESSRDALRHSVLTTCFDFRGRVLLRSFDELRALKISRKAGVAPFGETRGEAPTAVSVEIRPIVNRVIDGVAK